MDQVFSSTIDYHVKSPCKTVDHDIRASRTSTTVLHKPKSKMKRVMVTLCSTEDAPSSDVRSDNLADFDIDIKGSYLKKMNKQSSSEKSIILIFDTPEESVKAVVIVKEKETVVERIRIEELLSIPEKQLKTFYGVQMSLRASQTEWLPDVRLYDQECGYLCERELMFLQKRKIFIQKALLKLFDGSERTDIESSAEQVPHIALMGSGGGYRAMVAMSGIVNALYDEGLLDYILYTSVLSGSSWYIATLYSHPDWPNVDPRIVQNKMKMDISRSPSKLKNILYYGWDYFKCKAIDGQEWDFTTRVFGPMLGDALISDRLTTRWSEQADKLFEGTVPLPLLAAIHAKDKENAQRFHEWVEFSPYEVAIPKYGAAIDMKNLDSEFTKGVLTKENIELPLYEIMSICGSAFTLTWEELTNKDSANSYQHETQRSAYNNKEQSHDIETDNSFGMVNDIETDTGSRTINNNYLHEIGGTSVNPNDLPEEVLRDLEESFDRICQILGDDETSVGRIKEDNVRNGVKQQDSSRSSAGNDFQADNGNDIECDGIFPACIQDAIKKTCEKWWIVDSRRERAAHVNNFMRYLSFDDTDGLYRSAENALFENYLGTGIEKLCLIDAGLAFNSPYPLLFHPGRDIDLILSFDFTDRKEDSNSPFKTLLKAEQWAKTHGIKFHNIAENVQKYREKNVQELYIFEDEEDSECPTIMHFVLVNNGFRKYKKPGELRDEEEQKFADFNIFGDKTPYDCTNFHYTEENFNRLSELSEFIVLNNAEEIKQCIRVSTRRKIQRLHSVSTPHHSTA